MAGLLSMTDCTVEDNRVQARFELDAAERTGSSDLFTTWALKWGRELLDFADAAPTDADESALADAEKELKEAMDDNDDLRAAIKTAISGLEQSL